MALGDSRECLSGARRTLGLDHDFGKAEIGTEASQKGNGFLTSGLEAPMSRTRAIGLGQTSCCGILTTGTLATQAIS